MSLLDWILGRKRDLPVESIPDGVARADAVAVDRYERMLRFAPSSTIEAYGVEAFAKLTPAQLDILFERFAAAAENDSDPPTDSRPRNLNRSAAQSDALDPSAIDRGRARENANDRKVQGRIETINGHPRQAWPVS
ncbi:hypothetical protein [Orlajensenia leifsoniae]|uniref:hypothetical protein n=1 Tax=Orlajensenia leifsoniae TaxID=2561933 RepID=UPI00142FD2C0|nr:hypothetical protein [Leifsonia flava]